MTVWIVGQVESGGHPESVAAWTFQGVFAAEDEAVAACRDSRYFIGPVTMGVPLPHEPTEWPGCRYPIPPDCDHVMTDGEVREFVRSTDAEHAAYVMRVVQRPAPPDPADGDDPPC